jgi:HK97 family phage portal protein
VQSRAWSGSMTVDEWFEQYGPTSRSSADIAVTQLSALQVSTVMSCVSILSEDVAKLPVHVYRTTKNGGKQIASDHPIEKLLQQPNDFQSRFEFVEQMQAALLLRGNAYSAIIRDGRGKPLSLIPISPDRVWIYESQDGSVFYNVARRGPHDIAMLRSLPELVPSEDMFHLRWLSIDNSLWGSSRISLAREAIGLALSQQELAGRLSANSTNLGGILTTDQKLSQPAAERLQKQWKERKQGLHNAGGTAVLEQGLKWQQLGMTAQDAEFVASRNLQVEEIGRIFRMPPHKLGVQTKGTGSTMEQADQDYMNNVVSSYLERWESKMNVCFGLAQENLFIEFDINRFLRAAITARYSAYRTGIVGMFLKPNEARRAEGLPDVDGGDKLYQPTNVAELGFEPSGKESGPGSDVTGQPADGGRGDPAAAEDAPEDASATD